MKLKRASDFPKEIKNENGFKGMTANWLWTMADGIENFAMRLMEFEPGGHTSFHDHLEEHQFFFLEGEAAFVDSEGNEIHLNPGDTLYCAPSEKHQMKNVGSTVMRMICMVPILPGGDGRVPTHAKKQGGKSSGC